MSSETWIDSTGRSILVHDKTSCKDSERCTIHSEPKHHMKYYPQVFREDRGIVERICSHGIGHPDPYEIRGDGVHGCDGCCVKETHDGV